MKIKYLAHAAFLITSDQGVRIVTDPYYAAGRFRYKAIDETADVVTVSHEHGDHNNAGAVKGRPQVVKTSGEVKGIKIKAVAAAHDETGGSQRGQNIIFCFEIDGMKVCHLGDLGHELTPGQIKEIGRVDALMIPVGGFFTIDAATAARVASQLKAGVILPMHYKTDKADLPIKGINEFLEGKKNVSYPNKSEIELKAATLPADTQIIVLKPANY